MFNGLHRSQTTKQETTITWKIGPKSETVLVFAGLGLFSLLYYLLNPFTMFFGVLVLVVTGVYWGYSIKYCNPITLKDFRLITDRWQLYISAGTAFAFMGWGYKHIVSKLSSGQWLSMTYRASLALVVSIITVVIAEEIFFNGYLLTRLRSFTASIWLRAFLAVAAMAFYKVLIHIWDGHPINYYCSLFINETFLSYFMAWWADRTGSIVAPLTSHLVWDLLMYGTRQNIPDWVF